MYPTEYTWIRNPTPVPTRPITAANGSSAYPHRTISSPPPGPGPITIQVYSVSVTRRAPASTTSPGCAAPTPSRCDSSHTAPNDTRNDANTTPHPTAATARRGTYRDPSSPFTTNPMNGRRGISQSRWSIGSPAHEVGVVDVGRSPAAEEGDDDRQTDGRLRGGDRHDEEDEELADHRLALAREGDEGQINGVQHDLDAHQHDDEVPPDQHADGPD